jgi:S1-C subfamily serine protease
MPTKVLKPFIWVGLFMLLVGLTACGGASPTPEPAQTQAPVVQTEEPAPPTDTPEPEPTEDPLKVNSINDARSAVIQIQAEGTFVDPEFGLQVNAAGRGSGFIIDPSGLAVTNNHVVTGAALIKVRLADDTSWRNARLVGVSECSDLAVIDIEGDGFPYFEWYSGPVDVNTDISVVGFPLGDPEYTLTRGVISKARADGESSWASVDHVIEYDANALPGNSGGPVLAGENAQVIGVHYAGNQSTRQAYGISVDNAKAVVERLKNGEDVDSIGINGQAVATEDGSLTGIWISSVDSNSPAGEAGLEAGDILFQLKGFVLGTDGTMADYCDILRTSSPTDRMDMKIIRWFTGEILEGRLNSDEELEVTGYFGDSSASSGDDSGSQSGDSDVVTGSTGSYDFSASESGDIAFATDFDAGDLSDWFYFLTNGDEDDFNLAVQDNVLVWETVGYDNWAYLINDQITMPNVQIDVRVENRGVNSNSASLVCRYNEDGWYEFNIANDGTWTILRFDSLNNNYVALYTGGSTSINMGRGINDYTVVCEGNELSLWINNDFIRTVKDSTYRDGRMGISVSSFDQTPVIMEYDYVIFSVP